MKTFTIANTIWTMSDHLITRMEERGIDEFDIKCALKFGKSFASAEDDTALLTIFEMDPADYEGQMTNCDTVVNDLILVHKKNSNGRGREILTAYVSGQNSDRLLW